VEIVVMFATIRTTDKQMVEEVIDLEKPPEDENHLTLMMSDSATLVFLTGLGSGLSFNKLKPPT
jgi:hypothetical protein